jgi:hypothetical protein
MAHLHVTDDLDRRLRAARPAAAAVDDHDHDPELLAAVRRQPVAGRRPVPRAVALPVAAGAAFTAAAIVMLANGPGGAGGPSSSAAAIAQTLRWLTPASGTVLHVRSVETQGGRTTTRETWESADDPAAERIAVAGDTTYEIAGDAVYDPATNTIYAGAGAGASGGKPDDTARSKADNEKGASGQSGKSRPAGPSEDLAERADGIVADDVVRKVRTLLAMGHMDVSGPADHDGTSAYQVSLKSDQGRPVWKLWVSAADGKPLELRDPGRDASEAPQEIRWPAYEVLPAAGRAGELTLTGAHPSAAVVRDPAQVRAAWQRLLPDKP